MDFEKKESIFFRFVALLSVPLILFVLLLAGFLEQIPLKAELHSVIIVFLILLIYIFFLPHNAWVTFSKYKNKMPEILDEVDAYLVKHELIIKGRKKSFCKIDDFFESYVRNSRNDNFASVAASIFPTLGILGTFTAIAISMPNFSVASKEALENEITILLSGVGTAFYASIYGIFLSIWWTLFEKRGLSKIQNYIQNIKLSYKDLLWSKDEIELLRLNDSSASVTLLLEKIESIITPSFIFKLDEVIKEKLDLIKILENEYKKSQEKLSVSYETSIKLFDENSKRQEQLLNDFTKLNELITQNTQNNQLNQKALKNEIYSVLSSFELVGKDLKDLGKDLVKASNEQ